MSGLRESDTKPPFGKEVLFYKGKYYTLTDQRIPYMRDKTVDERYFILTLFAVGFELAGTDYRQDEIAEILNQQGRRKAQFIVNTVLHYLHCSETPDIPQPIPIDINTIEVIVRRIMEEKFDKKEQTEAK